MLMTGMGGWSSTRCCPRPLHSGLLTAFHTPVRAGFLHDSERLHDFLSPAISRCIQTQASAFTPTLSASPTSVALTPADLTAFVATVEEFYMPLTPLPQQKQLRAARSRAQLSFHHGAHSLASPRLHRRGTRAFIAGVWASGLSISACWVVRDNNEGELDAGAHRRGGIHGGCDDGADPDRWRHGLRQF
jgi:hypothetical protein